MKQAFNQTDLDFNLFTNFPGGCGDNREGAIRLSKSVYGLKHADRRWAKSVSMMCSLAS